MAAPIAERAISWNASWRLCLPDDGAFERFHGMAALEVLLFPFFPFIAIAIQGMASSRALWIAHVGNLEGLPESSDIVYNCEICIEDTALCTWGCKVNAMRDDVVLVSRDVVVVAHVHSMRQRQLVSLMPMLGTLHWIIIELCCVLKSFELNRCDRTWIVDIPLLHVRAL